MAIRVPVELYQYKGSELVTAPAAEPVTVDELKEHLRIPAGDTSEDGVLGDMIAEAREEIEQAAGMALITQTWRLAIDQWPSGHQSWWDGVRQGHMNQIHGPESASHLTLPRYPLLSVSSVKTYDDDDAETVVVIADVFNVDTISRPGRMTLKGGATWPSAMRSSNAILIEYTAGYGPDATDVPAPLRRAVKVMASYLYSHRGDGCDPIEAMKQSGAAAVVNRYRTHRI